MINEFQKRKIRKMQEDLGVSIPTIQRYNRDESWPEAIAIKVELLSDGEILASHMCPLTIGQATPAYIEFAEKAYNSFDPENLDLFIICLNFLEKQKPSLYADLMDRLEDKPGGQAFVQSRNAHRDS